MTALIVERIAAVSMVIVGLSHIVQARAWSDFFDKLFATEAAAFAIALYTLPIGLLIVVTHNVWIWDWPVILTVYGWGALIKSTIYLLYPDVLRQVANRKVRRPANLRLAGVLLTAMGALLAWDAFPV